MAESSVESRIECNPKIMHGEPVVRGTRITVAVLVGSLATMSMDEVLAEYPQISRADLQAAIWFASQAARNTLVA